MYAVVNGDLVHRPDELYHFGVLGMKWGVRRYQPYGQGYDPKRKGVFKGKVSKSTAKRTTSTSKGSSGESDKKKGLTNRQKTAIKVGVAVAGTALATYGVYKASQFVGSRQTAKRIIDRYATNENLLKKGAMRSQEISGLAKDIRSFNKDNRKLKGTLDPKLSPQVKFVDEQITRKKLYQMKPEDIKSRVGRKHNVGGPKIEWTGQPAQQKAKTAPKPTLDFGESKTPKRSTEEEQLLKDIHDNFNAKNRRNASKQFDEEWKKKQRRKTIENRWS